MKVSVNWIKEYVDIDVSIDELVDRIGKQLGAVEEVIDLGAKYQGIIVAKVVSCEKHPNADRLNVCMIDDGGKAEGVERDEQGLVQVVCGAPNVVAGLTVAWLPPGATVPSTFDKEPFVLEARELRGIVSNGMLASASELAISDDHSGIVELNPHDAEAGADFAETYKLNDFIIDIENKMFTHRPDCFGQLGVAREIAGILNKPFVSPQWYLDRPEFADVAVQLELSVENELPELVPRFIAAPFTVTYNGPSPFWLQTYLSRVGLRPINTLVDITNYVMMLTGQPLHAYDYDKVKSLSTGSAKLVIRHPKNGEKLTLLNGKEIEPRAEAIMIATDKMLIGVGGVMGGADTEVDENTKNVILECATFDMYSVRRTSMEHGLFTDAVTRFNKGQSFGQNDLVVGQTIQYMSLLTGAQHAGPVLDPNYEKAFSYWTGIDTTSTFINSRLGLTLESKEIAKLLQNVEFDVQQSGDSLIVAAPFWRTDISIPEDIVEEVGRLYGYDKLPLELPTRVSTPTRRDAKLEFKSRVRHQLARQGANEVLTYSFVHGNLLEKAGQDASQAFKISNALSPDLQHYRMSLTPSLLANIHSNIKSGYDQFALFEIGKVHAKNFVDDNGLPIEFERVALVIADKARADKPAYYQAQRYVMDLLTALKLDHNVEFEPLEESDDASTTFYVRGRAATIKINGTIVGRIGEYTASVRKAFKLPAYCAGFELGIAPLMKLPITPQYRPLSRYPSLTQDICLQVPAETTYGDLTKRFTDALYQNVADDQVIDYEPIDIYETKELQGKKRFTYRVILTSYERTLTDEVLSKLLDTAATAVNAERV